MALGKDIKLYTNRNLLYRIQTFMSHGQNLKVIDMSVAIMLPSLQSIIIRFSGSATEEGFFPELYRIRHLGDLAE
jgi:hypothetical protein